MKAGGALGFERQIININFRSCRYFLFDSTLKFAVYFPSTFCEIAQTSTSSVIVHATVKTGQAGLRRKHSNVFFFCLCQLLSLCLFLAIVVIFEFLVLFLSG